jgi:hypothetical protein
MLTKYVEQVNVACNKDIYKDGKFIGKWDNPIFQAIRIIEVTSNSYIKYALFGYFILNFTFTFSGKSKNRTIKK